MKQRDIIKMSADEIQAFLTEGRTLSVATIGSDGMPHLVAMWYVWLDDHIAFWTYGKSQKVVDMQRDPRLACMVEMGEKYNELRGVQIRGEAIITSDPAVVLRVGEAISQRYNGPLDETSRQMVRVMGAKRVVIFVKPSQIISWDHRKLNGAY